jgi:hypothetical protein
MLMWVFFRKDNRKVYHENPMNVYKMDTNMYTVIKGIYSDSTGRSPDIRIPVNAKVIQEVIPCFFKII